MRYLSWKSAINQEAKHFFKFSAYQVCDTRQKSHGFFIGLSDWSPNESIEFFQQIYQILTLFSLFLELQNFFLSFWELIASKDFLFFFCFKMDNFWGGKGPYTIEAQIASEKHPSVLLKQKKVFKKFRKKNRKRTVDNGVRTRYFWLPNRGYTNTLVSNKTPSVLLCRMYASLANSGKGRISDHKNEFFLFEKIDGEKLLIW